MIAHFVHQDKTRGGPPSRLDNALGLTAEAAMHASSSVLNEEDSPTNPTTGRSRGRHNVRGSPDSEPEISEDSAEEVQDHCASYMCSLDSALVQPIP